MPLFPQMCIVFLIHIPATFLILQAEKLAKMYIQIKSINTLYFLFMVFTLTRDSASKMIGVSTRTIDRYIQSGKIRTKRDGKVIMLHREDVTNVLWWSAQKEYEVIDSKPTMMPSISYDPREAQNEILRVLEKIIKEKDLFIQELTYKLGKMESEMLNYIPKIEHKKTILALEEVNNSRNQDINLLVQTKMEVEGKYQKEKLVSTILMIGVFVLLCACAVLIFHFFSLQGINEL